MRHLPMVISSVLLIVCGCNGSSSPSPPIQTAVTTPQLDISAEVNRLCGLAKQAEPEIAELRKAKLEISESLGLPSEKVRPGTVDWSKRLLDFRMRELNVYQKRSQDSPDRRALAEKFLKQYIEHMTGRLADYSQLEALRNSVSAGGSLDPMVEVYALNIQPLPTTADEMKKYYDRLIAIRDRIPEVDRGQIYDVTHKGILVHVAKSKIDGFANPSEMELARMIKDQMGALIRFMEINSEQQYLQTTWRVAHQFTDSLEAHQVEGFHQRIIQSAKMHDWYKLNAAADVLLNEGWAARGDGFASTVSEDGWKVLGEKLEQARLLSLLAWKMNPESSIPTAQLEQLVGSGANDEWNMHQWFQVSLDAQFDQSDAYRTYLHFISPNWGGSLRRLSLFAADLVKTARVDTRVPHEGLSKLWSLRNTSSYFLNQHPEVSEAISIFAEKALIAVKNKESMRTNLDDWNEFVLILLLDAKNYPLAKRWYEECGCGFYGLAMDRGGVRLNRAVQIIRACTGPASSIAIPLVDAVFGYGVPEPESLNSLREQIQKLRSEDPGEDTAKLCTEMELVIDQLLTFESGAWTELRFSPDMLGWRQVVAEQWTTDDDQTIRMQSSGPSNLIPVARFSPPFMIEADIQLLDPQGKVPNTASFLIAQAPWNLTSYDEPPTAQIISENDLRNTFGIIGDITRGHAFEKADSRHVRIKVWPHEIECSADGLILNQKGHDWELLTQICVGAPRYFNASTAYKFHRVRIRKMPYEAVIPIPTEGMAEYGQKVIEFDPSDPDGYIYRSSGQHEAGDHAGAAATLESALPKVQHLTGVYRYLAGEYLCLGRYTDAWKACEQTRQRVTTPDIQAIQAMMLACSEETARRDASRAMEIAQQVSQYKMWQSTLAMSLASAANGNMEDAKKYLSDSKKLTKDAAVLKLLNSLTEPLERGEVPVLKDREANH